MLSLFCIFLEWHGQPFGGWDIKSRDCITFVYPCLVNVTSRSQYRLLLSNYIDDQVCVCVVGFLRVKFRLHFRATLSAPQGRPIREDLSPYDASGLIFCNRTPGYAQLQLQTSEPCIDAAHMARALESGWYFAYLCYPD